VTSSILFKFGKLALIVLSACITVACAASADAKEKGVVDHVLIELHDQFRLHKESSQDSGPFKTANSMLRIVDESVLIDVVAADSTAALENDLRLLGATHVSSYGRIVSCFFPIERITELAVLDSLKFARPAYAATRPVTN